MVKTTRPDKVGSGGERRLGLTTSFFVYLNYALLILLGHLHDVLDKLFRITEFTRPKGYAPLTSDFEAFYTRRLYCRIEDCWNRPISGTPGAWIDILERNSIGETWKNKQYCTGQKLHCLNLASYNYLGFAENRGPILEQVVKSVRHYGISCTSPRMELGTNNIHRECEKLVAKFLGKQDAIVFGMGYGTNSTTIPALVGVGDLILSDSMNHASLVYGCRSSGARVKVFKHNDPIELESIIRDAICRGQPRLNRPWKRILIIIEGIYSMEGEVCLLPEFIEIKKKYKCYLYIDEAHSIGAIGSTARGVCEYFGVSTDDVDILMGTFTKSFASVGGYIAADKALIDYLRYSSYGQIYETSMIPGATQQALSSLQCIMGLDGTNIGKMKIQQLRENSIYFRKALQDCGFEVTGNPDSPVVPVMLYFPAKLPAVSRECLEKGIAIVVVGFPATPLLESRVRFCLSASHTKKDLEWAVKELDRIGDRTLIKYAAYSKKPANKTD